MASTRIDAGREEVAASTGGASQGSSQEGPAQASRAPTPAGARIGTDWAASDEPDGSPRQAVVLIHGLGDQPPMRSLRSFTVGIGLPRLFSSPDRVTDSTELRRLSEPPTPQRRAHTDFFELYWAHLAPDADLRTSLSWGLQLLLSRRWWSVGGAAARLVIAFQIAMAVLAALLLWGLVDAIVSGGLPGLRELLATWQVWLALALAVGGGFMGRLVRAYLSDAVRYLAPRPANIESRRRIREEGLTLLRRLHAGRYERIIIVGHSLGTVIGLDLVRSLWDELRHPDPRRAGDQAYAAVFDEACDRLDPGGPADGAQPVPAVSTAELDAFQAAQFDLWRAGRAAGVPWLISDFVSTGSPLTYAPLLLDEADVPFGGRPGLTLADLQNRKEVPRCPPIHDELEDSRFYRRRYRYPGGERWLRVGHTAAPFGPTRWTNLYLPAGSVLRGDFFGGPIARHFGAGVRDVPVAVTSHGRWSGLRRHFPLAHLSYWWAPGGGPPAMPDPVPLPSASGGAPGDQPDTIAALVSALRLDDIQRVPAPGPDAREQPP